MRSLMSGSDDRRTIVMDDLFVDRLSRARH